MDPQILNLGRCQKYQIFLCLENQDQIFWTVNLSDFQAPRPRRHLSFPRRLVVNVLGRVLFWGSMRVRRPVETRACLLAVAFQSVSQKKTPEAPDSDLRLRLETGGE